MRLLKPAWVAHDGQWIFHQNGLDWSLLGGKLRLSSVTEGKSEQSSRQPILLQNWLISAELVLLCMFQTNLLMGNCSWLRSRTLVKT